MSIPLKSFGSVSQTAEVQRITNSTLTKKHQTVIGRLEIRSHPTASKEILISRVREL